MIEIIAENILAKADIEHLFDEYHVIARYYHWSRHEIKSLPSKERGLWVDKIIEHENRLNGGDEDDKPMGD